MIKKMGVGFLFLISFLFLSSFVSAQLDVPGAIQDVISKTTEIAKPIFGVFVGEYSTDQFFFTKVLVMILIFVLVKVSLKAIPRFKELGGVVTIIAAVISILAIRFMKEEGLFAGILLPYGTLGIVLVTMLPFIAFIYILHAGKASGAIRRLGWLIYLGVFVALFISRYDTINDLGRTIYYVVLGAVLLALIFDKGIHEYFRAHELSMFYQSAQARTIAGLQSEYLDILSLDTPEGERRRKDIEAHLKRLGSHVP
ncbi:MAG: hypothetical protein Q7R87_00955 [Nanoarchaeota archaeon]|nr:hypothetical protein [Nanoarchaeota archaeon]